MKRQPDVRKVALVVALTAVAATAWATSESLMSSENVAARNAALQSTTAATQPAPVPVSETLAPGEEIVAPAEAPAPAPAPAPVVRASEPQPPVIVEERHLTLDERIQSDVMDKIAAAPYISGKIGVESHDAIVTLTGYTMTAGQAYRAGRYAGSVVGVKYVHNDIRPRIGGSV